MSRQSAGGFFSVPILAMRLTNGPMPSSMLIGAELAFGVSPRSGGLG